MEIGASAKKLVYSALKLHVSDIHLSPHERGGIIQFRLGDELYDFQHVTKEQYKKFISYFKFSSSMDIGEKRKPQNGALTFEFHGEKVHLRLSTLPTTYAESLVIRIHLPQEYFPISQLSLFPNTAKRLLALLNHSHGLLIFTGPTGCGKTTTMYTLLDIVKKEYKRSVVTLEDPIEKPKEGILQIQVNEKAGINYSTGLKAILRHDPDVIMVGEIRDEETARLAVRAAMTGHLVLTTLHTRNAKGAIYRLLDFGLTLTEIEQALISVAAQRLVNVTCPYCGDNCTALCKKIHQVKRVGVYELLDYKVLRAIFEEMRGKDVVYKMKTLSEEMNKAYALGYVPATTVEKEQ
ncbi:MAG: competence type IV pilus ATPase ComGA [Bacillaceae bacterium]